MTGKVVTVMNMKGGVGKTTVSMHIGSAAVGGRFKSLKRPLKVLLIDYDPQFNLSQALLPTKKYLALEKDKKTVLSVLVDDGEKINPYQIQVPDNEVPPSVEDLKARVISFTDGSFLDLVPSTLELMYVALGQANASVAPIEKRFKKFIEECKEKYDLIIIDCHPAGSIFTKTSLRNSDHVVIPLAIQRYALRGVGLMLNFIEAKRQGSVGPTPHILFNNVSRTKVSSEERQIRSDEKYRSLCFESTVKCYKAFTELDEGVGYVWRSKKSYSTEAWSNICRVTEEFLHRTGVV